MKRRRADGQLTIADAFSRAKASKSADSDTTAAVDDTTFGQGFSSANVCARASSLDEAAAAGAGIRSSAEEPPTSDGDHEDDVGKLFLEAERRHVGSSGPARGFSLQHLTRDEKAFLLQNHFRPGESFEFPAREERKTAAHTSKRYFQRHWLHKYKWLVYSPACNGGFCLPCVLFASGEAVERGGALYCKPLTNFTKAANVLTKHNGQTTHLSAIAKANAFRGTWNAEQPDVHQQLHDVQAVQARENVEKLKSIIKVVEFCGRQNIPLRGHRESGFSLDMSKPLPQNPGNFLALIRFRLEAGDQRLLQDFDMSRDAKHSGGKKVTYLSPGIQNEIIY